MTKGFVVENVITILDGADHAEVDALLAAEAVRAKELAAAGDVGPLSRHF